MIVIFGYSGFFGHNLTNFFKKNHNIAGISSSEIYISGDNKHLSIEDGYILLGKTPKHSCHIFCASMRYNPEIYKNNPYKVYKHNMDAFNSFISNLYIFKPKSAILTSSFAVYGSNNRDNNEFAELSSKYFSYGEYFYSLAKMHQEEIFIETCKRLNIKYSIARIPSLYGPNSTLDIKNAHVIPSFIMQALKKKNQTIKAFGTGKEKREFLYVQDLVKIYNMLLKKEKGILNISNQKFYAIKELSRLIELNVANKVFFEFKGDGVSDISIRTVENDKFINDFKDFNFTSFDFGLEQTIEWYKSKLHKTL